MSSLWLISYIALWILFLVLTVLVIGVLHLVGRLHNERSFNPPITSLEIDKEVPPVLMKNLHGQDTAIAQFRGNRTAFVIISAGCAHCHDLLEQISNAKSSLGSMPGVPQIVLLSLADVSKTMDIIDRYKLTDSFPVLVDVKGELKERWGINGTPATILIDENMVVYRQLGGPVLLTPELAAPKEKRNGQIVERIALTN